ncbi:MAG: hypothetical protein WD668_05505 [Saccharospirillum sp.]
MTSTLKSTTCQSQDDSANKVVHLYQVRPALALEHLKRTTGLDFDSVPQSLVNGNTQEGHDDGYSKPRTLTDVVKGHG